MKVELKSIKLNKRMSEETPCFSATLYVDGKKVGEVMNHGQGACNSYRWVAGVNPDSLEQRAREVTGEKFEALDTLVYKELDKWEFERKLNKIRKGHSVFRLAEDGEGNYRTVRIPPGGNAAGAERYIRETYGDRVVELLSPL